MKFLLKMEVTGMRGVFLSPPQELTEDKTLKDAARAVQEMLSSGRAPNGVISFELPDNEWLIVPGKDVIYMKVIGDSQ